MDHADRLIKALRSTSVLKIPTPAKTIAMKTPVCIEDLRVRARRKVPKAFYDYAESGSYNEKTLRSNCADLGNIKLRQRVMVDVTSSVRPPVACLLISLARQRRVDRPVS